MRVGIIDYGSGNIRSVFKSFEKAASLVSSKINIKVNLKYKLKTLKTICSTGSPLSEDGFRYIYKNIKIQKEKNRKLL